MSHAQLLGIKTNLFFFSFSLSSSGCLPSTAKLSRKGNVFFEANQHSWEKIRSAFRLASPLSVSSKEDQPKPLEDEKQ